MASDASSSSSSTRAESSRQRPHRTPARRASHVAATCLKPHATAPGLVPEWAGGIRNPGIHPNPNPDALRVCYEPACRSGRVWCSRRRRAESDIFRTQYKRFSATTSAKITPEQRCVRSAAASRFGQHGCMRCKTRYKYRTIPSSPRPSAHLSPQRFTPPPHPPPLPNTADWAGGSSKRRQL